MKFRSLLAAATMMALPLVANAQAVNGPYIAGGAGVNFMHDEDIKSLGGVSTSAAIKHNIGPVVVLSGGWGFGNGLRAELEGSFRYNGGNGLNNGGGITSFGGNEQKFGAMANVFYDFVGAVPGVTPYVGVGAGYQWAMLQNNHGAGGGTSIAIDQTKGAFAYQAILGAALPITGAPGLSLTAEYRFMGMMGDRNYSATVTAGAASARTTVKLDDNYNHSVLVGIRYAFGVAPAPVSAAPAVPVAAQVPARSYLVFFDWDKATLTDRARQIISEAAAASTKVQVTRIEVNGYTDSSGTAPYNQGLSMRRAQAVAAELVAKGVAKNAISIQGYGQTRQLVATGPGVREPQNRRVEIILK